VGNCVATAIVATWEKAIPPGAKIFGPSAAQQLVPAAEVNVATTGE